MMKVVFWHIIIIFILPYIKLNQLYVMIFDCGSLNENAAHRLICFEHLVSSL